MPLHRPYHHGDLRAALMRAALALVDERGPDGFTLREAARRVGVTHTAPYRHFPDKRALLAAIAGEGFDALYQAMRQALDGVAADDDAVRVRTVAVAFVGYAMEHRAHMRVMQAVAFDVAGHSQIHTAKGRVVSLLGSVLRDGERSGALVDDHPTATLTLWALLQGLSDLLLSGRAERLGVAAGSVDEIAARAADLLVQGLAPRAR